MSSLAALLKENNMKLLIMDSRIYHRWKAVGDTHSLTVDSDIAGFLLDHYQKFQSVDLMEECLKCHGALNQYCDVCDLIYKFTPAPSHGGSCDIDLGTALHPSALEGGLAGISDSTVGVLVQPEIGLPSQTVLGEKPCLSQNSQPPSLQSSEELHVYPSGLSTHLKPAAKFQTDDKQLPADSASPRRASNAAVTSKVELPCSICQNQSPRSRASSQAASADKPASLSAGFEHLENPDKVLKIICVPKASSLESHVPLPITAAGLSRLVKPGPDVNKGHTAVGKSKETTDRQMTAFPAARPTRAASTSTHNGQRTRRTIITRLKAKTSSTETRNEPAVKTAASASDVKRKNQIVSVLKVETSCPERENGTNSATVADSDDDVNCALEMDAYSCTGDGEVESVVEVDSSSSAVTLSKATEERQRLYDKSEDKQLTPLDISTSRVTQTRRQTARKLRSEMKSRCTDQKRTARQKLSVAGNDTVDDQKSSDVAAEASKTSRQKFPCKVCGKVMGYKATLVAHLRIHANDRPFMCPHCAASYTTAAHLKVHLITHEKVKPFTCPECSKGFTRPYDLKIHRRKHTKPQNCNTCGQNHRQIHKATNCGQKSQRCSSDPLRLHSADNQTQNRPQLPKVIKDFQCLACGQYFRRCASLRDHVKLHTGERPFPCPHCDMKYVQSGSLRKHLERHHNPDRKREWVCQYCGEARFDRWQLEKHMAIHTGSKGHQCQICSATFIQSSALYKHMKIHRETDGKDHRCPICKAAFRAAFGVRRHLRTVHRQEPTQGDEREGKKAGKRSAAAEVLKSAPEGVGVFAWS